MVASTNSNGIGRTLMQMDSPSVENRYHTNRRFLNAFQSYTNEPNVVKENFECQQCGKQFGNQHILKLHTRIHASQSLLQGIPGAAATLTQTNGTLHFNFNMTIDFSSDDPNGAALRDRLTNILKNDTLWENVSQSIANIRSQSGGEKRTENDNPEREKCQTPNDTSDGFAAVTESTETPELPKEQSSDENILSGISSEKEEQQPEVPNSSPSPVRSQPITRGKKAVGLTKIRMEDCRRCDECSCIYMDERDYLKHMKNFHKHDIKNLHLGEKEDVNFRPFRHKQDSKRQRQSPVSPQKKCRSCCKQCKCKGNHDTLQPMLPILRPVLGRQTRLSTSSEGELPSDIKDRWNKVVTQRLEPTGAEGSESDISHLLSQVEVKIEPTDGIDYFPQVKQEVEDLEMF